jgi:hypothetical protein
VPDGFTALAPRSVTPFKYDVLKTKENPKTANFGSPLARFIGDPAGGITQFISCDSQSDLKSAMVKKKARSNGPFPRSLTQEKPQIDCALLMIKTITVV